ncbi:MAG: polymerase sigma-B factor [Actinomycetota bacterium]|jgi:RNA polymerase sigma-B factor|nr:polymerase sigma-B factor [Actinomycetota bacterium]
MQIDQERTQESAARARYDVARFAEYQRTHDGRVRDQLVAAHIGLAYRAAQRFVGRGEELEDLRQVALIALVQAVERFDPSRGWTFATFASPTITGSLKRHFRDRAWIIRPPRSVQERFLGVTRAVEQLTGDLHRTPTVAEIADYGAWSTDEVCEALAARECRYGAPRRADDDDSTIEWGIVDRGLSNVEDREAIDHLLGKLGERERAVVRMRFFEGLDQKTISRRMGVSQMYVCRLLGASIERLRKTGTEVVATARS